MMSSAETGHVSIGKTGHCRVSLFYIRLAPAEDVCVVPTANTCPFAAEDICPVSVSDVCRVPTADISPLSSGGIYPVPTTKIWRLWGHLAVTKIIVIRLFI